MANFGKWKHYGSRDVWFLFFVVYSRSPRNLSGGIPVLVVRSFEHPFFIEDSIAGLIFAASGFIAICNRERSRVPPPNLGELLAELPAGCGRLLQKFFSDLGLNDRLPVVQ